LIALALSLALAGPSAARPVIVFPPEPAASAAPAEAWIGEIVADELPRALQALGVPATSRTERMQAHAALEIPAVMLTRATSIRMAEALGAGRAVMGSYATEGDQVTLSLRLLDVERASLSGPLIARGPASDVAGLVASLAWDVALAGPFPPTGITKDDYLARRPKIPAEAWKLYGLALAARDPRTRTTLLRRAVVAAPAFDAARLTLGELLLEHREFSAAHTALGRIADTSPLARQARFLQGIALLEIGRYRESAALFARLAESQPTPGVLNNHALAVLRDRGLAAGGAKASALLAQASALDPTSADVSFNRAWALLSEGDAQGAAFHLKDLVRTAPLDRHVRVVHSWALRRAGRDKEADEEWRAVLALAPSFAALTAPDLNRRFERILAAERPFAPARESRTDKELAAALLGKAQRLFDAGDVQGALPEATRAGYLDPYNRTVHLLLARLHRHKGDREKALNEFRMALWSSDDPDVRVEVATLLREMGRPAEAKAEAEKALLLKPDHEGARRLITGR
jgi:tetratricopeptide (TPR) repeat protein